jgi:hypothetical protein
MSRRQIALHVTVWLLVATAGWCVYHLAIRVYGGPQARQLIWAMALVGALAAGAFASAVLKRWAPLTPHERRLLVLAVGWAAAAAAGWSVTVLVGGPLSGLATALVALALLERDAWRLVALAALALFCGRVGLEMPGAQSFLVGAIWAAAATAAGATAGAFALGVRPVRWQLPLLIVGWAVAWIAAYLLKNMVGMPQLAGYGPNSLELVLAFAFGGLITPARSSPLLRSLLWAVGGTIASLIGVAIDMLLTLIVDSPERLFDNAPVYLAVGQTIGMAAGAVFAAVLTGTGRDARAVAERREGMEAASA